MRRIPLCRETLPLKDPQISGFPQQELANRRLSCTEGVFGLIKACMGLRQFLLRGLVKVRTEWLWACTAYNLKRLVCEIIRLRRSLAALSA